MYPNLELAMTQKRISRAMLATLIGCKERSMYNKMEGITDFTLQEALAVLEVFPEYNLKYLFERRQQPAA